MPHPFSGEGGKLSLEFMRIEEDGKFLQTMGGRKDGGVIEVGGWGGGGGFLSKDFIKFTTEGLTY